MLPKYLTCTSFALKSVTSLLQTKLQERAYCSVQFRYSLLYSLSASGLHPSPLSCTFGQVAAFNVNAALVELFPCTHPSTPSTRLDRSQVPFFKSLVWPTVNPQTMLGFTVVVPKSNGAWIMYNPVPNFFAHWTLANDAKCCLWVELDVHTNSTILILLSRIPYLWHDVN